MNCSYTPSSYNQSYWTKIRKIIIETTDSYSNLSPVYRMSIDVQTNRVSYYGVKNVKRIGLHSGVIPTFSVEFIVDLISSSSFFGMATEYITGQMDLSLTKLTVVMRDGKQRTIVFDAYAKPAILLALKIVIEHEAEKIKWIN